MKKIIYCSIVSLLVSCQFDSNRRVSFSTPDNLDKSLIVPTDTVGTLKIVVQKPNLSVDASDFIAETKYIPLETTDESLIGYCCKVIIYKDRIYIMDYFTAEAVFIFDINGKFLRKIATKGGGPQEFYLLYGMRIDRYKDQLILYDNKKRKMCYYTLEGDLIRRTDIKFHFSGRYAMLPSGMLVSQSNKNNENYHLNEYDDFRLIFTDSLGNITKFGFPFDDNVHLRMVWSEINLFNNEILYHPQYLNDFYIITDSVIRRKYEMDLRNFTPFNISRITEFDDMKKFSRYYYSTHAIESYFVETHSHFYFSLNENNRTYMYFYDKESGNMVGFKQRNYEYDKGKTFFAETGIEYPKLFNTDDYFIGVAQPNDLKNEFLKNRRMKGLETPPETVRMIEGLQEDDNPVLVLFKIKQL